MTRIENLLADSGLHFTVLHDGGAEECPCCGSMLCESIDKPFVPVESQEAFLQSWSLRA